MASCYCSTVYEVRRMDMSVYKTDYFKDRFSSVLFSPMKHCAEHGKFYDLLFHRGTK